MYVLLWIAWSWVFQKNEGIEDKKSNEVAGEVKEFEGGVGECWD
jgi:hypothetical protein